MAQTRAQKIRAERQEQLRDYLASRGLIDHVLDLTAKMEELEGSSETAQFDLQKLKSSADTRLKLINKYLPEMKFVEGTHTLDGEYTQINRTIVDPKSTDS